MTNSQIAETFKKIAGRLELEGENPFRIRAYRRAARTLEKLSEPLSQLAREGRIRAIPGIGKDLEQKILELLATGSLKENPETPLSGGASPPFSVPGLDPKIIRLLYRRFRMETPEDLEKLARSKLLRTVPDFGLRIEEKILKAFQDRNDLDEKNRKTDRDRLDNPPSV